MLSRVANVMHSKKQQRHADRWRWFHDVGQDIRYTSRTLRRKPGFSAGVILTMALGIGANTAVFSIVNAVLLKPLPYPDPNGIVLLVNTIHGRPVDGLAVSAPKFTIWRQSSTTVNDIAGYVFGRSLDVTNPDDPQPIPVGRVSADFFRLFGASVAQGRTFTVAEDQPGGDHVAIVSHRFWRNRLGGTTTVIGQTLSLDSDRFTIVGVLDASFDMDPIKPSLASSPAIWLPLQLDPASANDLNYVLVAGRLRSGVSFAAAQEETARSADAVRHAWPSVMPIDHGLGLERLQTVLVRDVRPSLLLLWSFVAFVLLIACANAINLLLVRASVRRREIAIRVATGASQGRITRQFLTEGVVLAIAGGAVGLALAAVGTRLLLALEGWNLPRVGSDSSRIVLDWQVFVFTFVTSVTTGIAFGVVPAFQATRSDVDAALKAGDRGGSAVGGSKVRGVLVACELALAVIVLIGAALLLRSFVVLRHVRPGFDGHNVLTMQTPLIGRRFARAAPLIDVANEGVRRLLTVPGVDVAASSLTGPPLEPLAALNIGIVGRPEIEQDSYAVHWNLVTPEYFDLFKIPVVRGRPFDDSDRAGAAPVALINQAMAMRYWPNADPLRDSLFIAPRIGGELEETTPRRIIGIVGDVRQYQLRSEPRAAVYVPLRQLPDRQAAFLNRIGTSMTWIIRTRSEPHLLGDVIQREVRTVSGSAAVRIRSMDDLSAASTSQDALEMWLSAVFGAVALLLAAGGLYGVMSYSVEQRRREIGIRMALGAECQQLRRMVLTEAMKLTSIGLVVGIGGALGLSRFMAALLFGIGPHDGTSFVAVPLVLGAVALAAAWLPARSASAVDPMIALRAE
jgi:predicted permease